MLEMEKQGIEIIIYTLFVYICCGSAKKNLFFCVLQKCFIFIEFT